ncbi:uncharacterized protein LOC128863389 [Anastrepha ludens]|uniref:uncharacterized protein LOC128863389 n=1 Tax=Anastrepha ludens TaxID=28586 RepID=UPI0023B0EF49|nr:uncharacterized protein LOC128863389 [Anastrepha ludens]XP_053958498.1 uncharacterized protein LOC128863389 [Anastrepha ludens]
MIYSDNETVDENQPPASTSESVPKHLRSRYWNSFEELRLVELWRLHAGEVTTLKKNIPVFRTISEGMREYGFLVNSQEVRRKINNFKNKYIAERRRMELGDDKSPSDWRLFPLVHCLLAPRQKNQLLTHQQLILDQLFLKIPVDLLNKELPVLETLSDPTTQPPKAILYTPRSKDVTLVPTTPQRFQPYPKSFSHQSSYLLRLSFTKERLTQIRVDNSIMSDQRDAALKQLKFEESSFKALESFLMNWQKKHECLLERL